MKNLFAYIGHLIIGVVTAAIASACAIFTAAPRRDAALASAWSEWERGRFAAASTRGEELVARSETADAGHYMLALVSHVSGDHAGAIAHYDSIGSEYPWLKQLDEPILWSYVHLGDYRGAKVFADKRAIGKSGATRARLDLAVEQPLTVEIEGVVELAFTDDALTPFMPGLPAQLNGRPTVARLDTGGAFVHLSSEQAEAHGIETVACERDFGGLVWGKVCYGVADLDLGPIHLRNVPVAVHEGTIPAEQAADAFGVELGPLIGTNVLQQFLSTIDLPRRRFIFSRRGDAAARADHLGRLEGKALEIPFAMWLDHFMIVSGSLGSHTGLNLFVDSGLVVATAEQGQAALLISRRTLAALGATQPRPDRFADLPGPLAIGSASREQPTAVVVPDGTWRDFGDWGGIQVHALISWGFLKHFTWTIDFDRYRYLLHE